MLKKVTQSKSKTPIKRSVHCKFKCITVALDRTQHGLYQGKAWLSNFHPKEQIYLKEYWQVQNTSTKIYNPANKLLVGPFKKLTVILAPDIDFLKVGRFFH